jgi:hypothetical protein
MAETGFSVDDFDKAIECLEKKKLIDRQNILIKINQRGIDSLKSRLLIASKPEKKANKINKVDLSFISDAALRKIIERDYAELQHLDPNTNSKSVLVLSGSIIEGLLIDALVTKGKFKSVIDCKDEFLKDLIYPAKQAGIIQHDNLSEVLQINEVDP